MKKELIDKSKELIMASQIGKYIDEEKIDEALKNVYVCDSQQELYNKYKEKTGEEYSGYLAGFNNNGISYFTKDSNPHAIIHEVLHTLSSEFDIDGKRVKNGIVTQNRGFENQINEGLTEYLTYKITGNYTNMYTEGKLFFKGIEESFNKYFQDENALLKIYFEKDSTNLEKFINQTFHNKSRHKFIKSNFKGESKRKQLEQSKNLNSLEYIYNNLLFLKEEQINALSQIINKGTQKILKDRELQQKHPLLFKIKNRILSKENVNLMLPESNCYNTKNSIKEEVSSLSKTVEEAVEERKNTEAMNKVINEEIEMEEKDIEIK